MQNTLKSFPSWLVAVQLLVVKRGIWKPPYEYNFISRIRKQSQPFIFPFKQINPGRPSIYSLTRETDNSAFSYLIK